MMKVGIDILENARMAKIAASNKKLEMVFTKAEIEYFNKFAEKLTHVTGNFCAKEAFVKALKTGFSNGITTKDIEILHDEMGVPYVNLENEKIKKFLSNNERVDISISHSETTSTAICVIYNG